MRLEKAINLAKRWMPGCRMKSNRPAWSHPEDVAKLVEACPLEGSLKDFALQIAWLHDIIEDGVKEDGSPVTYQDLIAEGVPHLVVKEVDLLSKKEGQPRWDYYHLIAHKGTGLAITVKILDRAANLKEGSETFGRRWFFNYRRDARLDFKPLLNFIDDPKLKGWLEERLDEAMNTKVK